MIAHTIPFYSLYALLFIDSGMSPGQVSALLAIWSVVGIVAEVPSGALADRFSRRGAVVASSLLQGIGFALWIVDPTFVGFALGFAFWGGGSSLSSGTFEAMLYDGLAASCAEDRYPRAIGLTTAAGLLAQVPAAVLATLLFEVGGYRLVGWVSVGVCLVVAALAGTLPDCRAIAGAGSDEPRYGEVLRAGLRVVRSTPAMRNAVVVVAVLFGLDALEEYFPIQIHAWGVDTKWVPVLVLTIPLGGAVGAALAGRGSRLTGRALGTMLGAGAALLGVASWLSRPVGTVAIVVFYGVYRFALGVAEARLQRQMSTRSRATATSVAALGGEIVGIAALGLWAVGGLAVVTAAVLLVAATLPRLIRSFDRG